MPREMIHGDCGVTILGRSGLRYREGSRTAFVDAEMLAGSVDIVVYAKTIKQWEGTTEPITEEERRRILSNIANILRRHKISAAFE